MAPLLQSLAAQAAMSLRKLALAAGGIFLSDACMAQALDLPLHYERFVLANGLTVIVNEDRFSPLVTVHVTYRVGSRSEPPGQSGMAHLISTFCRREETSVHSFQINTRVSHPPPTTCARQRRNDADAFATSSCRSSPSKAIRP